jgi:hypothetical protein
MKPSRKLKLTESQFHAYGSDGDQYGVCTECFASQGPVEPDARRYECEGCGAKAVYGLEEWLMAGFVEIVDEDTPEDELDIL